MRFYPVAPKSEDELELEAQKKRRQKKYRAVYRRAHKKGR